MPPNYFKLSQFSGNAVAFITDYVVRIVFKIFILLLCSLQWQLFEELSMSCLQTYQDLITSQQYLPIQSPKICFQNYVITCLIWKGLRLPTKQLPIASFAHSVLYIRHYCTQHIAYTTLLYTAYCPQEYREFQQYHVYYNERS